MKANFLFVGLNLNTTVWEETPRNMHVSWMML